MSKSDEYLNRLAKMTKANLDQVRMNGESEQEFRFRLKHGLIWTLGLCQISIVKSIEIDSLISVEEQCAAMSVKQNIEGLLSPDTCIKYCAYELKSIRDKYKMITGMDITNNIGVLTTLYNTGKVLESGAKYNKTHKQPLSNIFGRYVELQLPLLNKLTVQNK